MWKYSEFLSFRFGTLPVDIFGTPTFRFQANEAKLMLTNGTNMKLAFVIITTHIETFWTDPSIRNAKFVAERIGN
jgi:hypothetical protein